MNDLDLLKLAAKAAVVRHEFWMTPEDRAALHAAWALFAHEPERTQEWDFKAGFEAALIYRDDKDRANARLIAAAPDLLEFVEEVRRSGDARLASMATAVDVLDHFGL